jgi:hypothetical protein
VAHEHATKQGAYLLLLNGILILIFLCFAMHVMLSDAIFMMSLQANSASTHPYKPLSSSFLEP